MTEQPDRSSQVNVPPPPPDEGEDKLAKKEAEAFDRRDPLDKKRDHKLKDHFSNVIIWCVYIGTALLGLMVCVWLLHIAGPMCWRWLPESDIDKLQAVLLSGAVSSVLTMLGRNVSRKD